jgi:hypothetical protein
VQRLAEPVIQGRRGQGVAVQDALNAHARREVLNGEQGRYCPRPVRRCRRIVGMINAGAGGASDPEVAPAMRQRVCVGHVKSASGALHH